MSFQAKFSKNFLNINDVSIFLNFCINTNLWRRIENSVWDNRTIGYQILSNVKILSPIIDPTIKKIQSYIQEEYNIQNIYADTFDLCRWFPGSSQPPHCDSMENTPDHQHHKHRVFGAIIYLNDNYNGGHTYYPDHNFSIIPECGKLAVHLGDCEHRHGVTTIHNSTRYTLASFWTLDKNRSLSLKNSEW
jgi:hypothetical protein